ncbi:MAG: response regulator [Bacteroidales bacterium]|nr:response regulator [Bacteroidales bacterium]
MNSNCENIKENLETKNKTILIVDDIKINYLLIKVMLKKLNVSLKWVDNGLKAVEECKKNKNIILVLMDYRMPVMNGYEAALQIKKRRKDLPIISQSANLLKETNPQIDINIYDGFIKKPIIQEKLLSIITKYIN